MNRRILLVDDEEKMLDAFTKCYHNDFDVTVTPNPINAIDILHTDTKYAVIVSDMRMSEMNGIELLKAAKQLSPDSIRILLTGYADLKLALFAFNNDIIYRLIEKPCKKSDLLKHLNDACAIFNASIKDNDIDNIISLIESGNYNKTRDNIDLVKIFGTISERYSSAIIDKNISILTEFSDYNNSVTFDLFLLCDSLLFTIIFDSAIKETLHRALFNSTIKFHIKINKTINIQIIGQFENNCIQNSNIINVGEIKNSNNSSWLSSYSNKIILKELNGYVYEEKPLEFNDCSMKLINIVLPIDDKNNQSTQLKSNQLK